jgi:hypothetical protein
MSDEPNAVENDAPIPQGFIDPALGLKTFKQAEKVIKDGQRAVSEAGEVKKRNQELEEENRILREGSATQDATPPELPPAFDPANRGWGLAQNSRLFAEDLATNPLQATFGVSSVAAQQAVAPLLRRIDQLETKLSQKEVSEAWGDQTQDCVDHFGEDFVKAHKADIQNIMKTTGKNAPAPNSLFRHLAEVEKREKSAVQDKPADVAVEGASSAGAPAHGADKWINPDGTPMTSEQMKPHLIARGELDPNE